MLNFAILMPIIIVLYDSDPCSIIVKLSNQPNIFPLQLFHITVIELIICYLHVMQILLDLLFLCTPTDICDIW